MANMIPSTPKQFAAGSLEDVMFHSLEALPDDYYVFHSFSLITMNGSTISESETDFVIYNRQKGIICLEAKAGHVKYADGEWLYGSGIKMSHDGPYNQARRNKWKLRDYILNSPHKRLVERCKLLHAVWFPSITCEEFNSIALPPEALKDATLTKEDLENPLPAIEKVFSQTIPSGKETQLSVNDSDVLLKQVLCPTFDLVPSYSMENDLKKHVFLKMLNEQKNVLNYLTEQRTAVIQGVAGTGKTMIALEKARRHADLGERVLFLCYNKLLHDYISENNKHSLIDYYTIDGFACKLCGSPTADYKRVKSILEEYYVNCDFPYMHVVIDEGQDFGQNAIEENEILSLIELIIMDDPEEKKTFYVFYDSLQFVQGDTVPDFIAGADCKLTLYKNCRNTENIATTSMKPIHQKRIRLIDGCVKGSVPKMYYSSDSIGVENIVDRIVAEYEEMGISDITILTCKTEETSLLSHLVKFGLYKQKHRFVSCRRFKGLESDAVIIVDVDVKSLTSPDSRLFYVGSSRARLFLSVVSSLSKSDSIQVLKSFEIEPSTKNPMKELATELNCKYIKSDL